MCSTEVLLADAARRSKVNQGRREPDANPFASAGGPSENQAMDAAAYQLIRPALDPRLIDRGLRVLVGGPEQAPGIPTRGSPAEITERLSGFLAYAQTIEL